jgi:penicillin-binding protein 2
MIQSPDDRRPAMTPQLAMRVTVVGSFALLMFAIIFFRLWFLQVLSTTKYANASTVNRVRKIDVPAARGDIIDRNGKILVTSVPSIDVQISLPDLPAPASQTNIVNPPGPDMAVYRRVASTLNMSMAKHKCTFPNPLDTSKALTVPLATMPCLVAKQEMNLPYQSVTVTQDISQYAYFYLAEHRTDASLRGVEALKVYRRSYPLNTLAAQLFGTVGPINSTEITSQSNGVVTSPRRYRGLSVNAVIGQSGLEAQYDRYLRGTDGYQSVQVNSLGLFAGHLAGKKSMAGNTLKLSLDVNLQKTGEQSLATSIASNPPATGGAFVAMNPTTGEIYAMGSNPTFNPTDFTHPMAQSYYDTHYRNTSSGSPLFNRAISGGGPDGSTFKPITATAALESGKWGINSTYDDTGQFCFPRTTLCLHNAGGVANGPLDLRNALRVSDDVFFYNLGFQLNVDPIAHPNGGALQSWARKFGIGRDPGIDLPSASSGVLPSPKYLKDLYTQQEVPCENATGIYKGRPKHPASQGGCGIASPIGWTIGDNVNTAVGQGNVQVTPLQLAVAYAAIANGGTIVRPHVGLQIDAADGSVVQNFQPSVVRRLHINPTYLDTIRQGLRDAASAPGGTSATVFANFPQRVYGKTGTAQYNGQADYSWYACYVPASTTSKPIVVIVKVEQGGFGAVAAAPVARQILNQWFYGTPGPYVAGTSHTR